jgi:hypothetical protein
MMARKGSLMTKIYIIRSASFGEEHEIKVSYPFLIPRDFPIRPGFWV